MKQPQFSSSKSSKTRERESLYHIVWFYTSKDLQGFEQNTWTKYLNKILEQNTWTKNLNTILKGQISSSTS